ncbi:MAG: class I SAM-dependent methyltransferase [Candidatus Aenigmatarchaeota archaeon]
MAKTQRQKLKRLLAETKPCGKVLDVGAGPGFLEELMPAIATDIDLGNLKKAKGPKVLCSGDALPFKSKSFDWVFCVDTVHLLKSVKDLERVGKNVVLTAFCNESNYQEKFDWLKSLVKRKVSREILIRAENEWDAAIVCSGG